MPRFILPSRIPPNSVSIFVVKNHLVNYIPFLRSNFYTNVRILIKLLAICPAICIINLTIFVEVRVISLIWGAINPILCCFILSSFKDNSHSVCRTIRDRITLHIILINPLIPWVPNLNPLIYWSFSIPCIPSFRNFIWFTTTCN